MKHLQKILLALLVWGIAATGNSFAQLPRGVPDAIVSSPTNAVTPDGILPSKPYYFAVRTNMLYDAILLPTLGVEWRVNRDMGIKLDGSFGWWGSNSDKIQKVWFLNPEVRWYLLRDKRFYVGASGSYGEYNIYKYPVGSLFSKDTGYRANCGVGVLQSVINFTFPIISRSISILVWDIHIRNMIVME